MNKISYISELFVETGTILAQSAHPQIISGKVRELQNRLQQLPYGFNNNQSSCVIFFLDLIIEDIFYNLSGDTTYNDAIYKARDKIFLQMGNSLVSIGKNLDGNDRQEIWAAFCELVNVYLSELEAMNQKFTENSRG